MNAIEIKDLSFTYRRSDRPALADLNFSQREGEVVALAGRTGAGKSSLVLCLNRIIPGFFPGEFKGRIRLFGEDIAGRRTGDLAGQVGVVLQDFESQLFSTRADLNAAAPAGNWTALAGLPEASAQDVRLDGEGNQLFVALEGYGVYAALAPHRLGSFRLVNAADFSPRPAAPGSLLSVLGGRIRAARAGDLIFPVLAATDTETQIQVPFTARSGSLAVALDAGGKSVLLSLPVESVSPAIFIDRDGAPLALDADSGVLLDAMNPVRSSGRVQVLATGLGRVRPDWPAGSPGPANDPPQVIAPVRAWLDRAPVEVTRAVLAPGYVGLYLVEIQLPALVKAGPAELYLESETRESNRVRVWLEP